MLIIMFHNIIMNRNFVMTILSLKCPKLPLYAKINLNHLVKTVTNEAYWEFKKTVKKKNKTYSLRKIMKIVASEINTFRTVQTLTDCISLGTVAMIIRGEITK